MYTPLPPVPPPIASFAPTSILPPTYNPNFLPPRLLPTQAIPLQLPPGLRMTPVGYPSPAVSQGRQPSVPPSIPPTQYTSCGRIEMSNLDKKI